MIDTMIKNDVIDTMMSRKSVRHYDPTRKISGEELRKIITVATSAPSSWNLQHWKFLLIQDEQNKNKLMEMAWGQQQVKDCATAIVVLGDKQPHLNSNKIFEQQVQLGYMPEQLKNNYLSFLPGKYENDPLFAEQDAIRNASLVSMQIMLAAKALGIDSGPMIGFKQDEVIEHFNIPDRYIPVMIITLGYALQPAHPTIRLPYEDIVFYESYSEAYLQENSR